jgi:hypothetical protein
MTSHIATLGLMVLFVADFVGFVVWLMQTSYLVHNNIRFSLRGLLIAVTLIAIHLAVYAAFLSELSPHKR